jgi:hypothetical protein
MNRELREKLIDHLQDHILGKLSKYDSVHLDDMIREHNQMIQNMGTTKTQKNNKASRAQFENVGSDQEANETAQNETMQRCQSTLSKGSPSKCDSDELLKKNPRERYE